jgi:hypothetical protein
MAMNETRQEIKELFHFDGCVESIEELRRVRQIFCRSVSFERNKWGVEFKRNQEECNPLIPTLLDFEVKPPDIKIKETREILVFKTTKNPRIQNVEGILW